jgi:hypothetical protein
MKNTQKLRNGFWVFFMTGYDELRSQRSPTRLYSNRLGGHASPPNRRV